MKVSKRQLRRIIRENLYDPELEEIILEVLQNHIQEAVDDLITGSNIHLEGNVLKRYLKMAVDYMGSHRELGSRIDPSIAHLAPK